MMGKVLVKASGGGGGGATGSGDVASLLGGLVGKPKTALGGALAGGFGTLQLLSSLADAGANQQDLLSGLGSAGGRAYATGAGAGKVGDVMNPALLKPYRSLQYRVPGGHKHQADMREAVNAGLASHANLRAAVNSLPPPPPLTTATLSPPPLTNTTLHPISSIQIREALSPPTLPPPPVQGPPRDSRDAYERTWGTEGSPDWYQEKPPTGGTDFDMQNMTDLSATGDSMADVELERRGKPALGIGDDVEFPFELGPDAPPPPLPPLPPTVTPETEMSPQGYGLNTPTEEEDLETILSGGVELPKSEPMEIAFRLLKEMAR